jgi:hypothetical protein
VEVGGKRAFAEMNRGTRKRGQGGDVRIEKGRGKKSSFFFCAKKKKWCSLALSLSLIEKKKRFGLEEKLARGVCVESREGGRVKRVWETPRNKKREM